MKRALMSLIVASVLLNVGGVLQGQNELSVILNINPSKLNVRSGGVLPVVIVGTSDFDVSRIVAASLLLEGVAPIRYKEEDVASPVPLTGDLTDTDDADGGPDGIPDLTVKFDQRDVVAALGSLADGEKQVLTLTGKLQDETPIRGTDEVSILKKRPDFDGDGKVGFADFLAFAKQFGMKRGKGNYDPKFDMDEDGEIGFNDFIVFAEEFGSSAGKPARLTKPAIGLIPGVNSNADLNLATGAGDRSGEVEVHVRLADAVCAQGYSLRVAFDASVLEFVRAAGQTGSVFAQTTDSRAVAVQVSPAPGEVVLADVLHAKGALQGNAELVRLVFRILDETMPGYVEIAEALVSDGSGNINELPGTRLEGLRALPTECALSQNYPNPFNPTTQIAYQLPESGEVTVVIFNVLGQQIRTLVREQQDPGFYRVAWDGRDMHGRRVSTGTYLVRMSAPQFLQVRKMLLLK